MILGAQRVEITGESSGQGTRKVDGERLHRSRCKRGGWGAGARANPGRVGGGWARHAILARVLVWPGGALPEDRSGLPAPLYGAGVSGACERGVQTGLSTAKHGRGRPAAVAGMSYVTMRCPSFTGWYWEALVSLPGTQQHGQQPSKIVNAPGFLLDAQNSA